MNNVKVALTVVSITFIALLSIGQSNAAVDVKDATVIWLFDEGKGDTVADFSGNGNDGTISGSPKWVDGKFGKALELKTQDKISSSTANGVEPTYISETLWIKFNDFSTENQFGYISCSGTASARFFYFSSWVGGGPHSGIHLGTINPAGAWGRGIAVPAGVFKKGQWYHVAGVINNETGTTRAYVDGKMRHEQKFATGDTPGTPTGIYAGGTPENYQWVQGIVDEIAFFKVALTEDDINAIMDKGLKASFDVDLRDKLATTWGDIKRALKL